MTLSEIKDNYKKKIDSIFELMEKIDLLEHLEIINYYCEKFTTKNIAEIGVILIIVIPMAIFIMRERRRKI